MCLIVTAWRAHPRYRLILAGNRDEFHARPAAPAAWWPDRPELLAGRDLEAGGTWLGITRDGRFGAVTNYREGSARGAERSRGLLITELLAPGVQAADFAATLPAEEQRYAGFNLLFGNRDRFYYHTNREAVSRELEPGLHGVSNAQLDTPWPKLVRSRERLERLISEDRIDTGALLAILADREPAGTDGGPSDLDPALARALSAPFILTPAYGTRCSTVILVGEDCRVSFTERRFDARGDISGETAISFRLT